MRQALSACIPLMMMLSTVTRAGSSGTASEPISVGNDGLLTIVLGDGQAVVSASEFLETDYRIKFRITRNSCETRFKPVDCEVRSWISIQMIAPVWTQNRDASQIGRPVRPRDPQGTPLFSILDWTYKFWKRSDRGSLLLDERLTSARPPSLTCSDLSWAPAGRFDQLVYEVPDAHSPGTPLSVRMTRTLRNVEFRRSRNTLTFQSIRDFEIGNIAKPSVLLAPFTASGMSLIFRTGQRACVISGELDTSPNRLLNDVNQAKAAFRPIPFKSASEAMEILTRARRDSLSLYDVDVSRAFSESDPMLQLQEIFGLRSATVISRPDGSKSLSWGEPGTR